MSTEQRRRPAGALGRLVTPAAVDRAVQLATDYPEQFAATFTLCQTLAAKHLGADDVGQTAGVTFGMSLPATAEDVPAAWRAAARQAVRRAAAANAETLDPTLCDPTQLASPATVLRQDAPPADVNLRTTGRERLCWAIAALPESHRETMRLAVIDALEAGTATLTKRGESGHRRAKISEAVTYLAGHKARILTDPTGDLALAYRHPARWQHAATLSDVEPDADARTYAAAAAAAAPGSGRHTPTTAGRWTAPQPISGAPTSRTVTVLTLGQVETIPTDRVTAALDRWRTRTAAVEDARQRVADMRAGRIMTPLTDAERSHRADVAEDVMRDGYGHTPEADPIEHGRYAEAHTVTATATPLAGWTPAHWTPAPTVERNPRKANGKAYRSEPWTFTGGEQRPLLSPTVTIRPYVDTGTPGPDVDLVTISHPDGTVWARRTVEHGTWTSTDTAAVCRTLATRHAPVTHPRDLPTWEGDTLAPLTIVKAGHAPVTVMAERTDQATAERVATAPSGAVKKPSRRAKNRVGGTGPTTRAFGMTR